MARLTKSIASRAAWKWLLGYGAILCFTHPSQAQAPLPSSPEFEMVPPSSVLAPVSEKRSYNIGEILSKSLWGKQPDPERTWTPLSAGTFFSDGWNEPWNAPPGTATGGSLRQGWIGTNDAFFNRMGVGIYSYTKGAHGGPDEQVGSLLFENPITRRWMVGVQVPFVDSLQSNGGPTTTNFGDVTFVNRFMVVETQDTSISFNFNLRTPTGSSNQSNDRTALSPFMAYYFDVVNGVSIRGSTGVDIPVDNKQSGNDPVFFQRLAIGQTVTPHDVPLLGDFTYYLAGTFQQSLGNDGGSYFSLTPGIRTHLGNNWFLLAGVEVPLNGPRAFDQRFIGVLVKGY
jgi:hypothetical protein